MFTLRHITSENTGKIYPWLIISICIIISCNRQLIEENEKWMIHAERLLKEYPDSALVFLDSVSIESLNKTQSADYMLLYLQVKDRLAMDITNDTTILSLMDQVILQDDPEKTANAFFYAAKILESDNKGCRAMELYLTALKYAGQTNNDILKGRIQNRIGYLNFDRGWHDEALKWYRKALTSYHSAGGHSDKETQVLITIGNVFLHQNQTDSVKYYYEKALALSQNPLNTEMEALAYKNIGLLYSKLNHNTFAKSCLEKAAAIVDNKDDKTKAQIFMMLSDVYNKTDLTDSAKHYLELAQVLLREYNDLDLSAGLSGLFYMIEKKKGKYAAALKYLEQYIHLLSAIEKKNDKQELLELQRKYDMDTVRYKYQKTKIQWLTITLILSMSLLVLAIIFYFVRQKNIRNKGALEKAEKKLAFIQDKCNNYAIKENVWQDASLEKVGIMREIMELDKYVKNNKRYNQKLISKVDEIISKFNLQTFLRAIEEMNPGIIDKIRNKYPGLDEQEIYICCLCCLDFKNEGISLLMNKKMNTIQQRKTEIRRKIGIQHHGNIKEFLMDNLAGTEEIALPVIIPATNI